MPGNMPQKNVPIVTVTSWRGSRQPLLGKSSSESELLGCESAVPLSRTTVWGVFRAVQRGCVYGIITPLPGLLMCINAHLASLSFAWTLISVWWSWLFFCWKEQQLLSVNSGSLDLASAAHNGGFRVMFHSLLKASLLHLKRFRLVHKRLFQSWSTGS